ncbi:NPCBM/NEW2 domain-containing protein [uncultured Gimesia sp.]|uniref:NPCBM/NEW2 domain-containing protein n=1 Tax=uncultured Gimesia sp. TaxID=1678688 RepID=UPI0030DB0C8B|tara:strand:- start:30919 stop:32124 length:1206 start_codon:yes stop_codon:yes gene_type:complete
MRLSVQLFLVCFLFCGTDRFVAAADLDLADGTILKGTLLQIGQNQFTFQTEAGTRTVPAAEIIRVVAGKPLANPTRGGLVVLANDDRIHVEILRSEEESILVRLSSCPETGEWKIPLETIQSVFFQWPAFQKSQVRLLQKIAQLKKKSDLFYLKNGDFLEGEFLGFDAQTFRFESNAGETAVPRSGIDFFCFNPELINFPQPDQLRYRLELTDGTRLSVSSLVLNKTVIAAKTLFGAELKCRLDRLVSISPLGGLVVPLSQLEPSEYQFTPYFTQQWGWRRNRNVVAGPLRVGGREYATGLGVHSAAELRYTLDGKYAAFQTEVGIDDSTNGKGTVEVSILVDQRVVYQRSIQGTEQQRARAVPRIDLSGARELVLKVEFGKNADIQDLVNWCRPVLILQK